MTSNRLVEFQALAQSGDYLILDTETTGLHNSEIVQIAIIRSDGSLILDTLIKPLRKIERSAFAIHGINAASVKDAPLWSELCPIVADILLGKNVVVYNVAFDLAMLVNSTFAMGMEPVAWRKRSNWYCAMLAYSEIHGDWQNGMKAYRWQKLETAVHHFSGDYADQHTALGDCRNTLFLTKKIAGIDLS